MGRRLCVIALAFAWLAAFHAVHAADDLQVMLDKAIADAEVAEASEISTGLLPVVESNGRLLWKGPTGQKKVLCFTYTNYAGYNAVAGGTMTLAVEVWSALAPEFRTFTQRNRFTSADIGLRVKQLMGLPYWAGKDRIIEMWVDPADLFRPSADPEVTDNVAELTLSPNATPEHQAWYNSTFAIYGKGYPWTRLGYTYDWGNPKSEVGLSEYVIRKGAVVEVRSVTPVYTYCRGNAPQVGLTMLDGSLGEDGGVGRYLVWRKGSTGDLPVSITFSGTAIPYTDYLATGLDSAGVVTIPDGVSSTVITIQPIPDTVTEGAESVTLTIGLGEYSIVGPGQATLTLLDNTAGPVVVVPASAAPETLTRAGQTILTVTAAHPDNGPLAYTWSKVAGPADVIFGATNGTASGTSCTADFAGPGLYVVAVDIGDDLGYATRSLTNITVGEEAEVVRCRLYAAQSIGGDDLVCLTLKNVTLTALAPGTQTEGQFTLGERSVSFPCEADTFRVFCNSRVRMAYNRSARVLLVVVRAPYLAEALGGLSAERHTRQSGVPFSLDLGAGVKALRGTLNLRVRNNARRVVSGATSRL